MQKHNGPQSGLHTHSNTSITGGLITTVPTSADEAKAIAEGLIRTKGGELLSKVTGTSTCLFMDSWGGGWGGAWTVDMRAHPGSHVPAWMTGGLITTVPMSAAEAKQMGQDLIQTKGGKLLSKISGGVRTFMQMCSTRTRRVPAMMHHEDTHVCAREWQVVWSLHCRQL